MTGRRRLFNCVRAVALTRVAGAPTVWDQAPDNVAFVWEAGNRDAVARAFETAAHVARLDFVITRVNAAPLEPRAAVGEYDRRTGRFGFSRGFPRCTVRAST